MRSFTGHPAVVWALLAVPWCASCTAFAQASTPPVGAPVGICYEDEDNYPWFIKGGKGASVVLMELAASKAGVAVELHSMPWNRCLALVERGASAGALGASYTQERAQYAVYPMQRAKPTELNEETRLRHDVYSLYRRVGASVQWDGKSFSGLHGPIGHQTAYSIGGHLRKLGVETFDGSKSAEVVLRRVLTGDLQGAALQSEFTDRLLQLPEFQGRIEKVTPPLLEKSYFLVFNKSYFARNEPTATALWAALEKARKSAEYRDTLDQLSRQRVADAGKK